MKAKQIIAFCMLYVLLQCGCSITNEERYTIDETALGEKLTIEYTCDEDDSDSIRATLRATLMDFSVRMSSDTPESDVSRLNLSAENENTAVDPRTMEFLLLLQSYAESFGDEDFPDDNIYTLSPVDMSVRRLSPETPDFHSLYYGYAVQRVYNAMEEGATGDNMITCHGVFYARGTSREGAPYRIAIPVPGEYNEERNILCFAVLDDMSVCITPTESTDSEEDKPLMVAAFSHDPLLASYAADFLVNMTREDFEQKLAEHPEIAAVAVFSDNTVYRSKEVVLDSLSPDYEYYSP